jgi:hypothetical protein
MESRQSAYRAYHLVSKHSLYSPNDVIVLNVVKEINKRVDFTKKYYRNRYDSGHKHWMKKLGKVANRNLSSKLGLSLDSLITLQKLGK